MKIDEIHEMVRGANPVPDLDVLEPIEMPFLPDRERSGEMSTKKIDVETPEPRRPRVRRGLLIGVATAALIIIVGVALAFVTGDGTEVAEVEPGPITSFEDIAGTTYQSQGRDTPSYFHFFEDGTWHVSSNRFLVEKNPLGILETRFEGTKVFLTNIKGACVGPSEAVYEIELLENGNLQVVLIEDTCTFRSDFFVDEWAPLP